MADTLRVLGFPSLVVFMLLGASQALAVDTHGFDLPEQPLADSLRAVAAQTGADILFDLDSLRQLRAPSLRAELSTRDAIERLIAGKPLRAEAVAPNAFAIRRAPARATSPRARPPPGEAVADTLEQVVITARKRAELLQSAPVAVSALDAPGLVRVGQFRAQDFAAQVPGLTVTPNQFNGSATLALRGITSGDLSNPTVGATLDDVAIGSSTSIGGGYVAPDLDPGDLARIEVLRGPQGTLYGASSIGGLVKYSTVDPSTDGVSGRVEAGGLWIRPVAGAGYTTSVALNIPVGDHLAFQGGYYRRELPGYIDNIRSGIDHANGTRAEGGHLAMLWRPTERFSLKISAFLQDSRALGASYVTVAPGIGDLQQDFLPETGFVERRLGALVATASARLGAVDLVSISGYASNRYVDRLDYSVPTGQFTLALFDTPYAVNTDDNVTRKLSEELRASMALGRRADWLVGAYATRESSPYALQLLAADAAGSSFGRAQQSTFTSTYDEWAAFSTLTYQLDERLDVQVGARSSRILQGYEEFDDGPLIDYLHAPHVVPRVSTSTSANTYLLTPRLELSPDAMLYLRAASGYRPGGINPAYFPGIPRFFSPDKTTSLELGLKARLLGGNLSVGGSAYDIDWRDIQLTLTDPASGENYFTNGGGADSKGAELSVEFKAPGGWHAAGWLALVDARLSEAMPAASTVAGSAGDRLPYSSRWSANVSVDRSVGLRSFRCVTGANASYVGERLGTFVAAAPDGTATRQVLPAYVQLNLWARLEAGAGWSLVAYANNVTDRRGMIGGGIGTQIPSAFQPIQPRTLGFSLEWSLEEPR